MFIVKQTFTSMVLVAVTLLYFVMKIPALLSCWQIKRNLERLVVPTFAVSGRQDSCIDVVLANRVKTGLWNLF